jgi:hypothetical protein
MSKKKPKKRSKFPVGRPPHQPTAESRMKVWRTCATGGNQERIAAELGIDPKTLRAHYRYELDYAAAEANDLVAGTVLQMATGGGGPDGWRDAEFAAAKYWLQTRAHWKQDVLEISGLEGGPIETKDVSAREFIASELARLTFRSRAENDPESSD